MSSVAKKLKKRESKNTVAEPGFESERAQGGAAAAAHKKKPSAF